MKATKALLMLLALAGLVACVTINVYFPEAAAEEAADRFIDDVIGPDGAGDDQAAVRRASPASRLAQALNPLHWLFPAAHAQADLDIDTPAIRQIQARMEQRFQNELRPYFESGAIGFTNDALVAIRDLSQVPLAERNKLKAAVNAENSDRNAVYREIAVANGHPEWEARIRATFAERWIAKARPGWYYQNGAGDWVRK